MPNQNDIVFGFKATGHEDIPRAIQAIGGESSKVAKQVVSDANSMSAAMEKLYGTLARQHNPATAISDNPALRSVLQSLGKLPASTTPPQPPPAPPEHDPMQPGGYRGFRMQQAVGRMALGTIGLEEGKLGMLANRLEYMHFMAERLGTSIPSMLMKFAPTIGIIGAVALVGKELNDVAEIGKKAFTDVGMAEEGFARNLMAGAGLLDVYKYKVEQTATVMEYAAQRIGALREQRGGAASLLASSSPSMVQAENEKREMNRSRDIDVKELGKNAEEARKAMSGVEGMSSEEVWARLSKAETDRISNGTGLLDLDKGREALKQKLKKQINDINAGIEGDRENRVKLEAEIDVKHAMEALKKTGVVSGKEIEVNGNNAAFLAQVADKVNIGKLTGHRDVGGENFLALGAGGQTELDVENAKAKVREQRFTQDNQSYIGKRIGAEQTVDNWIVDNVGTMEALASASEERKAEFRRVYQQAYWDEEKRNVAEQLKAAEITGDRNFKAEAEKKLMSQFGTKAWESMSQEERQARISSEANPAERAQQLEFRRLRGEPDVHGELAQKYLADRGITNPSERQRAEAEGNTQKQAERIQERAQSIFSTMQGSRSAWMSEMDSARQGKGRLAEMSETYSAEGYRQRAEAEAGGEQVQLLQGQLNTAISQHETMREILTAITGGRGGSFNINNVNN